MEDKYGLKLNRTPMVNANTNPKEQAKMVTIRRASELAGKYRKTNPPIQAVIPYAGLSK
ncbi:hypothetical protein FSS13T_01950 [Flavobacterium saliperosum S13]|uniref:Uncharacterized protein n=1 Tax=Flavobacterium saliperosum S13 TaxID=1341155 RepID=A0ABN0QJ04_9FLAO|nr:hypothetical protein FSS13T_01950 [Flavobacterium saliperosum S13]